jgi:hypothetical protein
VGNLSSTENNTNTSRFYMEAITIVIIFRTVSDPNDSVRCPVSSTDNPADDTSGKAGLREQNH